MREELIPFDKEARLYLLRKRGNQLVEITKGKNKPTQAQRFQISRTYTLVLDQRSGTFFNQKAKLKKFSKK